MNAKIIENNIKLITPSIADEIIRAFNEGVECEYDGLYYFFGDDRWIGIDNSTGDCWVEESSSLEKCIDWLIGEIDAIDLYL